MNKCHKCKLYIFNCVCGPLMKKIFLLLLILISISINANAATWYIRPSDGGNGTQCDGHTDHAVSGATGTNCALNSLYWVLPAAGQSTSKAAAAGDTIVIVNGSNRIGCQNASTCADSNINLVRNGSCNEFQSYDCVLGAVPSGTSTSAVTKIIGCTTTGCSGGTKPELWGAGTIPQILDVSGRSYVTIQDLEITDHASCGFGHPTLSCGGTGNHPSTLNAGTGIKITNSSDVTFKDLNIHGMSNRGMLGGSVGNHTYNNVTIFGNALAGIDYDTCNNDGTCGVSSGKTMTFSNGTNITYSGCIENSSSIGTIATNGCYDQNNGGYGDGIAGTNTSGTWTFTDVNISHNFSDGLDMLYMNRTGASGGSISIKRSRFEGNIGQQVKADPNIYVEDSYIIGNCSYWVGKSYTLSGSSICRALGSPISITWEVNSGAGTQPKFYNNTITSNGDVMFLTGGTCTASTPFLVKNNLLLGGTDYLGGDQTSIFYNADGTCSATFTEDYNTCSNNFKEASPCPASHSKNNIASSSTYSGTINQGPTTYYTGDNYINELTLKSSSTAIDAAITSLSGQDSLGYGSQDRGGTWDMGALDYASGTSPTCGDGVIATPETCDDSNTTSGDGCSSTCTTETGYTCSGTPSTCSTTCGDGIKAGAEGCDDGGVLNGDGCSSTCTVESGWSCTGTAPSVCTGSGVGGHPGTIAGKVKLLGGCTLR